ncbi:hypothetical protein E5288_WYG018530 [Bos mutus]|uniref:Uncharacterized protein n=1 Tax=Bos mutus TaxID=72004 RepID=A0A6B0RZG6_9CETA|nr:hypothetical protein [Bos mutus]
MFAAGNGLTHGNKTSESGKSKKEAEILLAVRRDERPLVRGLTMATPEVGVSLDAAAALEDSRSANLYRVFEGSF